MDIKAQINKDLKTAMLAGDKQTTTTLRGIKSAIQYAEVADGQKDAGFDNEAVTSVLAKEAKKRQDAIELYEKAGQTERAKAEATEKAIIEQYLPAQLSDEELIALVDQAIAETAVEGPRAMGQVIGVVKKQVAGQADGGRIAQTVKERLG